MQISLIWILNDKKANNNKTFNCLKEQFEGYDDQIQILAYKLPGTKFDIAGFPSKVLVEEINLENEKTNCQIYEDAASRITGEFVTMISSGDTWNGGAYKELRSIVEKYKNQSIFMMQKIMPSEEVGAFSDEPLGRTVSVQKLWEKFYCYPFYFGGTVIKSELLKNYSFNHGYGLETERAFFLSICKDIEQVVYDAKCKYHSITEREGDDTFFEDMYEPKYYEESFTEFWIPYLSDMKEKEGKIPVFIQYHAMFTIVARINANMNNKNKHVIEDGSKCFKHMGAVLQFIDDDIINNGYKVLENSTVDSIKWFFGMLKYGTDFSFERFYHAGKPYYGYGKSVFNAICNLKTNILFMNYQDGKMEIDGTVHPLLMDMADEVFFTFGGKKYLLDFNGRYSHTKVFGIAIYKSHSFHVSIPIDGITSSTLYCYAKFGRESLKINFQFESHTSRMSGRFENSYWQFGREQKYLVTNVDDGMKFAAVDNKAWKKQEKKLQKEMLFSMDKRAWLFIAIRKAYFAAKPFMKRKPIWMYLDKIYKGGDSSEYLYKYASAQKNNFKHYYLVDKSATDYKRLKKEGYKPLVRGSIKHRLVFLMADMMVISNSTVFTFNNFGMINSSYVRDLVDFHVCCVQHGMSVQKIAVAQNRLRDNTRLYFCASQYEIDNLSRPIYDYEGYDALKLTGVPRYDGLVDNEQKQIMISPTWRMQAAAPVRTSEGEQRDYNPLFKESTYFRVFNSLINDPRLIDAAKKYGYKIKYVLHPIVSSQVKDFDTNEFVEIVPAVGDMSYEKMFCESSLMVTDFSGIQFDFAYMRKPLVYLHHKDIPQHYEEGTFFYDTMAFGEICHDNDELIDTLCEYMANGCKMKEEYVKRADDFFYYDDHKNCERIYKEMIDYQNKYVL